MLCRSARPTIYAFGHGRDHSPNEKGSNSVRNPVTLPTVMWQFVKASHAKHTASFHQSRRKEFELRVKSTVSEHQAMLGISRLDLRFNSAPWGAMAPLNQHDQPRGRGFRLRAGKGKAQACISGEEGTYRERIEKIDEFVIAQCAWREVVSPRRRCLAFGQIVSAPATSPPSASRSLNSSARDTPSALSMASRWPASRSNPQAVTSSADRRPPDRTLIPRLPPPAADDRHR